MSIACVFDYPNLKVRIHRPRAVWTILRTKKEAPGPNNVQWNSKHWEPKLWNWDSWNISRFHLIRGLWPSMGNFYNILITGFLCRFGLYHVSRPVLHPPLYWIYIPTNTIYVMRNAKRAVKHDVGKICCFLNIAQISKSQKWPPSYCYYYSYYKQGDHGFVIHIWSQTQYLDLIL